MPGKALNTRLKNMKSWVSSPRDKNFKDLSSPKMQSHVIHNKMKFCSIALTLLKKPAIEVCLPTLETSIFQWSWMCWWGGVGKGKRENHLSLLGQIHLASHVLLSERVQKKTGGAGARKGTQRGLVIIFFPRILSHGSRWSIPGELDPRKQLLPGPGSNSWGHRSSMHKLNARNQWVVLCLQCRALTYRLMLYACLDQTTRKNNTIHFDHICKLVEI